MGELGYELRTQHNDAQFFAQLAIQSASGTFSRAALAPRKLPVALHVGARPAAADQHAAGRIGDQTSDDFNLRLRRPGGGLSGQFSRP